MIEEFINNTFYDNNTEQLIGNVRPSVERFVIDERLINRFLHLSTSNNTLLHAIPPAKLLDYQGARVIKAKGG